MVYSLVLFITLFNCVAQEASYAETTEEISFTTNDGLKIFGDLSINDKSKPLIILFHQAGANARGEYQTILPKLVNKGYNVLAVDQRSGGDRFGFDNRTTSKLAKEYQYCETYPDFEASLQYAQKLGISKIIVWGSSYSAALVIKLAAKNTEAISGVLAFSPASGGPMANCKPDEFIENYTKPLFIGRPAKEAAIPSVKSQIELARSTGHEVYVAENVVHGSSMLVEARTKSTVEETWEKVFQFLGSI